MLQKRPVASKRGRPRAFDRDEALAAAMKVFWVKGYEGATLEELQHVMGGITAPSLYNAFGSKEELFREAIDLYVSTIGAPVLAALTEATTTRGGIEAMLREAVAAASSPDQPRGCLLLASATRCSRGNESVEAYVRALRLKAPEAVRERLLRGVEEGELPRSIDVERIAAFYATVAQGIGARAGDGVPDEELIAAVDGAMAAWETLVARPEAQN